MLAVVEGKDSDRLGVKLVSSSYFCKNVLVSDLVLDEPPSSKSYGKDYVRHIITRTVDFQKMVVHSSTLPI